MRSPLQVSKVLYDRQVALVVCGVYPQSSACSSD
jgi:hypothetical protein